MKLIKSRVLRPLLCLKLTWMLVGIGWWAWPKVDVAGTLPANLANLPLSFEENLGQVDAAVKYLAHGHKGDLFLTGG